MITNSFFNIIRITTIKGVVTTNNYITTMILINHEYQVLGKAVPNPILALQLNLKSLGFDVTGSGFLSGE
jgi:hypothetical protein